MERLLDFLNKLEQAHIYYKLSKYRPEYIMVEIAVPGERWEVEFSVNDIYIEKFITDNGNYRESELEVLLRDFSD